MRLIAVPLARSATRSTAQPVCTFLAQRIPAAVPTIPTTSKPSQTASSPSSATTPPTSSPPQQLPLTTRLLNKASNFWLGLGQDGQDGKPVAFLDWKRRTYTLGERVMDRIEYEEWALKAVDPTLGPKLIVGKGEDGKESQEIPTTTIPLLYPPTLVSPTHLLSHLKTLTAHRSPHHRTRLIWSVIAMPFTIPFALIPVVPNLPFFYLVWRSYSHWRAFQSSKYLATLLQQNRIVPTKHEGMTKIYQLEKEEQSRAAGALAATTSAALKARKPGSTSKPASTSTTVSVKESAKKEDATSTAKPQGPPPVLLLSQAQIGLLTQELKLDVQSKNEVVRARQQTVLAIEKGDWKKIEAEAGKEGGAEEKAKEQ